jgi:hypothetical protein
MARNRQCTSSVTRTETESRPAPSPTGATASRSEPIRPLGRALFLATYHTRGANTPGVRCGGRVGRRTALDGKADQYLTVGQNTGHVNAHARQRFSRVSHTPVCHVQAETLSHQWRMLKHHCLHVAREPVCRLRQVLVACKHIHIVTVHNNIASAPFHYCQNCILRKEKREGDTVTCQAKKTINPQYRCGIQ